MTSTHAARHGTFLAAVSVLVLALAGTASAQRVAPPRAGAPHQHFDGRFANNHYYYNRGYRVRRPPPGSIGELHGPHGGRYWVHHGNWYRWHSGGWVVWSAPAGVLVPWLPPYFSTIWWNGVPYYYANDTYYVWDSNQEKYQVVTPPAGIEQGATTQAPTTDQLFVYPKKGQSAAQQSDDEYACHRWALAKSGFDPTLPGGGVPVAEAAQKRSEYLRADAACLEGRGYTVK